VAAARPNGKRKEMKKYNILKRKILWLWSGLLLLLLGYWLEQGAKQPPDMAFYQQSLQRRVQQYEAEILDLFANGTFVLNAVQSLQTRDTLDVYERKPYTFLIFDGQDSLIYWSNNKAFPYKTDVEQVDSLVNVPYRIQNSDYLFFKQRYNPMINGLGAYYSLVVLLPIHEQYSIQNGYLQNNFLLLPKAEAAYVEVSETPTPYVVRNNRGVKLVYMKARAGAVNFAWACWALAAYLLGSFFTLLWVYLVAQTLARTRGFHWGFGTLILGSFLIRAGVYYFDFPVVAQSFDLFKSGFTSLPHWWSDSLGEFILEVGVLLLWAFFLHWELRLYQFRNWSAFGRLIGTAAAYGLMLQELFLFRNLLENVVTDSRISFRFDNLSQVDMMSFLALFGIFGMALAMLLSNYRLLFLIKRLGYKFRQRVAIFMVSAVIQVGLWFLGGAAIDMILYGFFFSAIFVAMMSVFSNRQTLNLSWLSLWLMYFSFFGMVVINTATESKQAAEYKKFVSTLANERDMRMEAHFQSVQDSVLADDFFVSFFTTATFISRRQAVERILFRYLDPYYFGRYDYNVALYDGKGGLHRGERRPFEEFINILNKSETINNNLYFYSDWEGRYNYIARLPIYSGEQLQGLIVIEFIPKTIINKGNVFVELLQMQKNTQEYLLGEYQFALYKKDRRVWHNSSTLPLSLPYDFKAPEPRNYLATDIKNEPYLLYRGQNNNLAIVKGARQNFLQLLTTFAYIFCIGVLFSAVLSFFLWLLWRFARLKIVDWPFDQSLRERIQLGIVFVSIISFAAIAFITIFYFSTEYADYHDTALTNRVKTTAQLASLQVQTNIENNHTLPDVNKLSEISRLDVNMYDLSGNLIKSSSENVFDRRLISRQMNPVALHELRTEQITQFIQDEQIATFKYLSAYIMLRDNCDTPIAYLNLPYDTASSNKARAQEVAQFLGTLLNVYVLFLLLASGAALFIARSITRPLAIVAEKLRQVKLDKKNEPLDWQVRDEIGGIVARYNQMIIDLETNKQALERTQRESAWRDMAKQVAHEIKNPLTPMKLNIQFLQRLFETNPEKAKAKIERISAAIIEQIDNLAAIASEFSAFAQMPAPVNEKINLANLVESVFLLFGEEQNAQLTHELPADACWVFADKNQLIRVLNNLIKNAIQAIDDDNGRVNVRLFCKNNTAFLSVEDNGCGIPEERKSQIFTPYFTSKSSGTGIGLSMCKTIITMANGKIYFDSMADVGSVFTVELPMAT
jgi:signal transduction histidine kinase